MTRTTLPIPAERCWTWEQAQAGRAKRRRIGNLVAPPIYSPQFEPFGQAAFGKQIKVSGAPF